MPVIHWVVSPSKAAVVPAYLTLTLCYATGELGSGDRLGSGNHGYLWNKAAAAAANDGIHNAGEVFDVDYSAVQVALVYPGLNR